MTDELKPCPMEGATEAAMLADGVDTNFAAAPLSYVKVKPIVWEKQYRDAFDAQTVFGQYRVRRNGGGYYWAFGIGTWSDGHPTLEAAQAAAYDDLCKRVKELF